VIGPIVDEGPNGLAGAGGTALSIVMPGADRPVALSPELVDLITEAVAMPATAAARAEVIRAMLLRALDAVSWRQEFVGDGTEESSLLRVVKAAEAHRQRMAMASDRLR
jgi:hypothetical protein